MISEILWFGQNLSKLFGQPNKSKREKQVPYELIYKWNLNKQKSQPHRYTENRLVVARVGLGGYATWTMVVKRYKVPVVREISPRGGMCIMVTVISKTVWHVRTLLRE